MEEYKISYAVFRRYGCHMLALLLLLLWVKDAPKINQDSDDDVYRFIDKYITAMIPKGVFERQNDVNIMKSLQTHTHSDYCCRN